MLVANSFDLWQKDAFFSAAEEVQQSADLMESAYRTWLRAMREERLPQHLDELGIKLQRALGTAKWQLEEFKMAVCLSHKKLGDDITIARHKQFVSALEEQISSVEAALREAKNLNENKTFQWVNLDEQECDDLAIFLSGTLGKSLRTKGDVEKLNIVVSSPCNDTQYGTEDCRIGSETSSRLHISNHRKNLEVCTCNDTASCFMELENRKLSETEDQIVCQTQADRINGDLQTWGLLERSVEEIVIDCDDKLRNPLNEATLKENGSRPSFWRSRCEEDPEAKGLLSRTNLKFSSWMNQTLRSHRSQRQQLVSPMLPVGSLRFMLAVMLTIFLVVPFLVYSN